MASPASSSARTSHSRQPSSSSSATGDHHHHQHQLDPDSVPVEVLVEHLLAAKRSLSSIALVLRGHELAVLARRRHEDAAVLSAQTAFLRRGAAQQLRVLARVRAGMGAAYDARAREFRHLIKTLDAADGRLQNTMAMLRGTPVDAALFSRKSGEGEERKTLMDFVDEKSVERMREALKESVAEMQVCRAPLYITFYFQFYNLLNKN